jgi:predicted DNA binding CopG/RHH family protein
MAKTRIEFQIESELLKKAKIKAINAGWNMTKVITHLLQQYIK